MVMAGAIGVVGLVLIVSFVGMAVSRRRRGRRRPHGAAAERALRAQIERAEAQERATRMHPDAVRSWMRPR